MIKITVKSGGRELTLEGELPQNYVGCSDPVSEGRVNLHVRAIKDIITHAVEKVKEMNQ